MKNPLFQIVQKLLSKNKIAYDKKELAFQIQSHPSYPSLHAITGVLDHFNIENIAAEVPTDTNTLQQLPDTFIAQVNTDKGSDLVTVSKSDKGNSYSIFSSTEKEKIVTESDFIQQFTGIIVAVEKTESITTPKESKTFINLILLAAITTITALLISQKIELFSTLHIVLSILGIIASYSILKQELGENTVIGEAFCSGNDEKKDCDAVLNSKGAEIIKGHKLSDLSVLFFAGLTLSSLAVDQFNIIYAISFLALPITLYSIYYQYRIVKSWCTLCLSIVGVLWLQAGLAFLNTENLTSLITLDNYSVLITTLSFLTVYISWRYVKPLVKEVIELRKEKIESVKFKRNFELFNNMLQKSPKLNTVIPNTNEIVFGNKDATLEIVIITNPFCGHCKPVHTVVDDILRKYDHLVKVVTRFNVYAEDPNNNGTKVASTLINIYNTQGETTCKKAMDEIYEGANYESWLSTWDNGADTKTSIAVLENEKKWCTENGINFTPEILINGKAFPKEYGRTDLVYFIEDLEENYKNITHHSEI